MYSQGAMTRNMFSLYFAHHGDRDESRVWFGGYSLDFMRRSFEKYKDLSDAVIERSIVWMPIDAKQTQWNVALSAIWVNDTEIKITGETTI
jgi:hypothetical protein